MTRSPCNIYCIQDCRCWNIVVHI